MGDAGNQALGLGRRMCWALASLLLCLQLLPLLAWESQYLPIVCGRTEYLGRIFGGQKANPERWPWQASLLLHGRHICGAALIDKNWVASAAHCFQRSHSPSDYKILLGYNQLSHPTNFSRQMTVNKLIVHPNYDKIHRMGSDIVLMQLHRPVEFNTHILPVCIPDNTTQLSTFTPCWISGWGMITENKFLPAPLQLQEAKVALLENDFCASYYQPPPDVNPANAYIVKEDMLCASDLTNEKSICRGDSGGPLVCEVEEIWYLIGLSSWSSDCIHPIGPSVFTRITYFTNWINEKKQENPDPDLSLAPPEEEPPALMVSCGTVLKPQIFTVLLSCQILLLQLNLLRNL